MYESQDRLYCYPNSNTLINLLGIRSERVLAEWESRLVSTRLLQVLASPPAFEFTIDFLGHLHWLLFRDVYAWAGKARQVDLSKGDTRFAVWEQIDSEGQKLFASTPRIKDTPPKHVGDRFIQIAAPFLIELNVIHPFREGNGRTMRLFVELWANTVGQSVAWDNVGPDEVIEAMVHGVTADSGLLESVLARCLRPVA